VGLRYSYEIIFSVGRENEILNALLALVSPECKNRIVSCIPWEPKTFKERDNDYCFSFYLPLTADLRKLIYKYRVDDISEEELHLSLGCIWTTFTVGSTWGWLSLTAATSGISRVFEDSEEIELNILNKFSRHAEYIVFDDEANWHIKYPKNITFDAEELHELVLDGCTVYAVDHVVELVRKLAQ